MIVGWVMFVYREDSAEVAMSTVNGKVVLIKYHLAKTIIITLQDCDD